jgi:glycosyltransferase involved in cell wall biosynthesis
LTINLATKDNEATTRPTISVIVPTYNRKEVLLRALDAALNQTYPADRYEVLVVDDGSSDGTQEAVRPLVEAGRIRYHRQPNSGPAAARNAGIRLARGEIVLFIGDDIFVPPDLLDLHQARRAQFPAQDVAVLGRTTWSLELEMTPLMRYSQEGRAAPMFQFDRIADADNVSYEFFFTGNVSLPRQFMLEHGLFDEDFPYAYGEDTELGYRLLQKGLRLVFEPKALAHHYHLLRYGNFRRRAIISGEVSILQVSKHPEWASLDFLQLSWRGKIKHRVYGILVRVILDPLLALADRKRWDLDVLPALYQWTLCHHALIAQLKAVKQRSA